MGLVFGDSLPNKNSWVHNTLDFPNRKLGKYNTSKKRWIELAIEFMILTVMYYTSIQLYNKSLGVKIGEIWMVLRVFATST